MKIRYALAVALMASMAGSGYSAVGRLPAGLQVAATGQAGYSVPLNLPAGTNGLRPQVAAAYDGGAGRGLLGVGWSISGLSSISRCSKSRPIDGEYQGNLLLNEKDAICLDGSRLYATKVVADKAVVMGLDEATSYRTELQQFRKVDTISLDATNKQPNGFKVTALDGSVWYYGEAAGSRVVAHGKSVIVSWLLSRIVDRFGNTISYSYTANGETGAAPDKIVWTSNAAVDPVIGASHQAVFDYEDDSSPTATPHADVMVSFVGGSRVRNPKLLKAIKLESKDDGKFVERRRYSFSYRMDGSVTPAVNSPSKLSGRPLLERIQMCEGTDCVPATSFSWNDAGAAGTTLAMSKAYTGAGARWQDTGEWGQESHYSTIRYLDINGDGLTDVCGRSSRGVDCYPSDGSGFSSSLIQGPAWSDATGWSDVKYYSTIRYPDLNGDGLPDVCGRNKDGIVCHLNNGNGFSSLAILGPVWSDAAGWGEALNQLFRTVQFGDLNQDGRDDICGISSAGLVCYLNQNGAGFESTAVITNKDWIISNDPNNNNPFLAKHAQLVQIMDYNGDRVPEVCVGIDKYSGEWGSNKMHIQCMVKRGAEYVASGLVYGGHFTSWIAYHYGDVNGDGLIERCDYSVSYYVCLKNLGVSDNMADSVAPWVNATDLGKRKSFLLYGQTMPSGYSLTEPNASAASTIAYLDMNQDGRSDVCERTPFGVKCRLGERVKLSDYCAITAPGKPLSECFAGPWTVASSVADAGWLDLFWRTIDGPAWSDAAGWNAENRFMTIGYADVNGDGYPEVCGKDADGIICHGLPDSVTSASDKIVSIVDGLDQETRISYAPLTDSSVYTKGAIEALPKRVFQPAAEVVSRLESSNGIGGVNATTYKYSHLVAHIDRGGQGFQTVEARDETTGIVSKTTYKQDFPFTGLVEKSEQFLCTTTQTDLSTCTKLSETANTWAQKDVMPALYTGTLPYLSESVTQQWDVPSTAAQ